MNKVGKIEKLERWLKYLHSRRSRA